jgi:hypothetical protein
MSTDPSADTGELAVGTQVRAIDSEPVFSSDPTSGDEGEIVEASAGSYLVRWESGSETWMRRANLEPVADLEAESPEAVALPAPVAGPIGRGRYLVRYGGIIVFGLLTARNWIPALGHAVSHPTPRSIVVIVLAVGVAGVAIAVRLSRASGMRRARSDREPPEP